MKLLSILLSVVGVSSLVLVCPALGALKDTPSDKTGRLASLGDGETRGEYIGMTEGSPNPPVPQSPSQPSPIDLLVQNNLTRVTGVEVIQTNEGLELILKTATGSERLVPLILPEGNDLVIDILDATLAFSIRNGVTETSPAPGISRITVSKANENSIRVRITGENQIPSAEVLPGRDDLVLSVTPEDITGESEPDEEIEVIATGQAEDEDTYYIPDASRTLKTDTSLPDTPASVQVVPQQVIEDQNATNVREIVRNASGVNFSSASGSRGEQFIIRGFSAERFRNGFRDGFSSSRTQTELANIDRVEVLKGPVSVLFGRAEPGGIINYVTKQPLREPFYEIAFTAGSFNFYRPTLDFSAPLTEDGNLAYRLNVAYENADSFRDGVETERFLVAPTLFWQVGDNTELTLEFSYLNDTRPIDRGLVVLSDGEVADIPFSSYLGDPEPREDFDETRTELYLDHRFNPNLSLRSLLRYTTATESGPGATVQIIDDSQDDRNFLGDFREDQFYETFTFQNDLTGKFNTGSIEHTVLFGLEYTNEFSDGIGERRPAGLIDIFNPSAFEVSTDEPFEIRFFDEDRENSFGIYLQDQIAISDNLQLVLGGRFDTYNSETTDFSADGEVTETEADAFSPRVGIVYQPIEPVSLYANYTRSFTPVSGSDINDEPFEPQRGTGFEIGVKGEIIRNKLFSTLALYDTTLTNITTEDPNNSDFEIQTGEQNSQGIELDIQGGIFTVILIVACTRSPNSSTSNRTISTNSESCRLVKHDAGKTEICGQPQTVVALSPRALDVMLALDIQPAAYAEAAYTDRKILDLDRFDNPSRQIPHLGDRITT